MISADRITLAVVLALRSNSSLISALGGVTDEDGNDTIIPHYFFGGADNAITRVAGNMSDGRILLGVASQIGGNFDGTTIFKHRVDVYIRARNAASQAMNDPTTTSVSLWGLWALLCNGVITSPSGPNLRSVRLLSGDLDLMDTPTAIVRPGEDSADLLYATMVFPEVNDSLND